MKFRLIEVFKAMMECGTVTAAAHSLKISQPAMTKQLTQLQNELNLVLFEQRGGRLVPTSEAQALIGSIDRAWRGVIELKEAARDVRDMRRGRLTVVASPSFAQTLMADFVAQFTRESSKITIALHAQTSPRVIDWTADGQADIGISMILAPRPGVHVEALGSLVGVCALPIGHALAANKVIRAEDLHGQPFISLAEIDGARSRVEAVFDRQAIDRDISLTTPQSAVALALVARGAGVAIIDEAAATMADLTRVAIRPFLPTVSFEVYMYHPANKVPSQLNERFVRQFRTWFKGYRATARDTVTPLLSQISASHTDSPRKRRK
ncbi:LysR family transcriptional regulator [Paralcaligenes ureilyticus]|uniref:LysR family transcriptional regulator n=1 Tax=Paralcaligenes ureilyticus TaxID=627131 RepID=A0A4V2UXD5_9BURK|nr:LysR family transcriptional regulator [Paralcaligenes ureilyticus]TCT03088.1 LysR family transcriptional regulator [Paralcaligenes ureilyticus]